MIQNRIIIIQHIIYVLVINNQVKIFWMKSTAYSTDNISITYPISFSKIACINGRQSFSISANFSLNWWTEFRNVGLSTSQYQTNIENGHSFLITGIGF